MNAENISVLLVSENDGDTLLLQKALREANLENPLYRVHDCLQALSMLRGVSGRAAIPWPRVILLDSAIAPFARREFVRALQENPVFDAEVAFLLTPAETTLRPARYADDEAEGAGLTSLSKAELAVDPESIILVFEHFWSAVTRGTRRPPAA